MTTLYTATGRFETRIDDEGRKYPVIILGNIDHTLELREMILWVRLNWRILEQPRIKELYESGLAEAEICSDADFKGDLNRLIRRGVIVSGSGETGADALDNLLGSLYIVPVTANALQKAAAFLKMLLLDHTPFRTAVSVFYSGRLTELERQILILARQATLSTAQLIQLSEDAIENPLKNTILQAVSNLYLHKQIILERS
jgi:hypothetical protein